MPSKETLTNMFMNNDDGGGFAFNLNGEVIIKKGYMTLLDFLDAIQKYDLMYNFKEKGVLIHTRITTHGGTNPEMCHPFPIVSDEGALRKIEYASPYAVIHNGIISLTSAEATAKKSLSDTAVFIEEYLCKIAKNKNWFDEIANMELVEKLIGSKMAVLDGQGRILMTSGFTLDNGIYYSNTSYKDNYSRFVTTFYDREYAKKYFEDEYDYYSGLYPNDKKEKSWSRKEKRKKFPKTTSLMKANPEEIVCFDDSRVEDADGMVTYFVDELNNIYAMRTEEFEHCGGKFLRNVELQYDGKGGFLDNSFGIVPFKANYWTNSIDLEYLEELIDLEEDMEDLEDLRAISEMDID